MHPRQPTTALPSTRLSTWKRSVPPQRGQGPFHLPRPAGFRPGQRCAHAAASRRSLIQVSRRWWPRISSFPGPKVALVLSPLDPVGDDRQGPRDSASTDFHGPGEVARRHFLVDTGPCQTGEFLDLWPTEQAVNRGCIFLHRIVSSNGIRSSSATGRRKSNSEIRGRLSAYKTGCSLLYRFHIETTAS